MKKDSNAHQPTIDSIANYLNYTLSLPERTVRSTAAVLGGLARESVQVLVPTAFQDSKTYRTFVKQMLDMVAHDVGGVEREEGAAADETQVEGYVAKKTVGSFIDIAGMATLHVSPLTILAIVSDMAYGSNAYLKELAGELKKEGVIDPDSTIDHAADLLEAVGKASGDTADRFDRPPLSIEGLRQTIEETRESVGSIDPTKILPEAELNRLWGEMQGMAEKQNVGIFAVSSAMTMYTLDQVATASKGALTTIRVTGQILDREIVDHYWAGLQKIHQEGIYKMLATTSQPYIEAVWLNFSDDRETITEGVLSGKLIGKAWDGFKDWLGGVEEE